jgi:PAS domain S-box-containing protein
VGRSFLDLTHPDYVSAEESLHQQLMGNVIPKYQLEKRYLTKDKREIWCKVTASAIRSVEGEPLFRLAVVENIHERKQAETALQESEERFRTLAESANESIVSTDSRGRIIYSNLATERLFQYSREELAGQSMFKLMSEQTTREYRPLIQDYLATGKATLPDRTLEWTGRRKDGREFPVEVSYFSWKTPQGMFFTSLVRDITERKQIDDMKRDVISIVSHQLKTPVAEINGYIENLLDGIAGVLTPKQREYLTDMREIGGENYRLLSDLLNMSKIERGIMTVDIQPIHLDQIVELTIRDYESAIRKKGLDFKLELAGKKMAVLADQDKTVEAVRNILNNAVKCTDKGAITVETGRDGDFAVVQVRDTGIGMSREVMDRLFTKGRALGSEAKRSGAGIGLYIAKSFMQLQGGDITAESEAGKGSVFSIKIPLVKRR